MRKTLRQLLETDTEYRRLERDLRANPDDPALRLAFDQARRRAGQPVFPWRDRFEMQAALKTVFDGIVGKYRPSGTAPLDMVNEKIIRDLLKEAQHFADIPVEVTQLLSLGSVEHNYVFRLLFGPAENKVMFVVTFPVRHEVDRLSRRGQLYIVNAGLTGRADQEPTWQPLWRAPTREESDLEVFLAGGKWSSLASVRSTLKKRKFTRVPDSEIDNPRTSPRLREKAVYVGSIASAPRWLADLLKTSDGSFIVQMRSKTTTDEWWKGPK